MATAQDIDINCDMGESYGSTIIGDDASVFPYISSCNIACGFHGGDPVHMEKTVLAAIQHGVRIGAHPSYPDRWGFGRRKMQLDPNELMAYLRYQIAALCGVTSALGGKVMYVKPHGALYNVAVTKSAEAKVIVEAMYSIDPELALMGLPGSEMERGAGEKGIRFIPEAFADRRYDNDGHLVARHLNGAVIDDPQLAAAQVLSIVERNEVESIHGKRIPVIAKSICVHGDHPNTRAVLHTIERILKEHGIQRRAFNT